MQYLFDAQKAAALVCPQTRIQPALIQQLRMATLFHYAAFVEHDEPVHRRNGGEPVRDRNHGFDFHQLVKVLLNRTQSQCAGAARQTI